MYGKTIVGLLLACLTAFGAGPASGQPAQAGAIAPGGELHITAGGVNSAQVALADVGQVSYAHDAGYTVEITVSQGLTEIKIARKPGEEPDRKERLVITLPDIAYGSVTVDVNDSGMGLPAFNGDITVSSNDSAVSLALSPGFAKRVRFTAVDSAASISLNGNGSFSLQAEVADSAMSVPKGWPAFRGGGGYSHASGDRAAVLELDIRDCAFSIEP